MLPDIDVLGLSIKTFGLFFGLNFVAWGLVTARRLRELGRPVDWASEMVLVAVAGGLIGAKLYFVFEHPADLSLSGLLGGSGLVWYGGLAGGAIAMVVWARRRDFLNGQLLGVAAVGLPLGYAIGRIGCQVSGDGDYGVASSLPWAMPYPDGVVPTDISVHPSPIYESLVMGIVALGLWRLRDRVSPGALFALYLVLAGIERFAVEFVRRNDSVAAGLTEAQLLAAALAVVGLAWLAVVSRRGTLITPGGAPATP